MLNPIVFMSVLGIAANFVFSQHVPNIFRGVLTVLGKSKQVESYFTFFMYIHKKLSYCVSDICKWYMLSFKNESKQIISLKNICILSMIIYNKMVDLRISPYKCI